MQNDIKNNKDKKFYVIGAGLARTGTLSLMYALEILLPGKCYHGLKAVHHEKEWCDIMRGKYSDEEYKNFMLSNDYVAGLDSPFCYDYERAIRFFPDAKVVLTVRDPEAWVKSVEATLLCMFTFWYRPAFFFSYFFPNHLTMWAPDETLRGWSKALCDASCENEIMNDILGACCRGDGAYWFQKWIHDVESKIPEDKLLKFNVKDGWEPESSHS